VRPWEAIDWAEAFARLHPVLLHLPIGLWLALAWLQLFGSREGRESGRPGGRTALVCLLVLSSAPAGASGWLLHEGASYPEIVEWHEWGGIALVVLSLLLGFAHWRRSRWYGAWLWIGVLVLLPTSHFGGALTHGEDFLLEPWLEAEEERAFVPPAPSEAAEPAEEEAGPPAPVGFEDVQPLLEEYCFRCHGEKKQRGDLALHTLEAALAGGDGGPSIVLGDPGASLLIQRMRLPLEDEDHMPPENKPQPPSNALAWLEAWIAGAPPPQAALDLEEQGEDAPSTEPAPPATGEDSTGAVEDGRRRDAIAALRERLAHVQPVERDSRELWVELGEVEGARGQLAAWLDPLRDDLRDLGLAGQALDAADLAFLGDLPGLRRLDLRRLEVAHLEGGLLDLEPLRDAPALRVLNLAGTPLAPNSLEVVAELPELERVFLWGTGLDGEDELAALRAARAELEVVGASAAPDEPLELEPEVQFTRAPQEPVSQGSTPAPVNGKCPVSGGEVDPRYVILHEGRAIGFCCPNCPKSFWEEPERYLDELE